MNENNNLRIGANGAGLFVGSTEIMGGGLKFQLNDDLDTSSPTFIIINQSNKDVHFRTALGEEIVVNANSIYSTSYNTNEVLILQDTAMCTYKFSGCGADGRFYEQYYGWLEFNAGEQFPYSDDVAQGTMIIQII